MKVKAYAVLGLTGSAPAGFGKQSELELHRIPTKATSSKEAGKKSPDSCPARQPRKQLFLERGELTALQAVQIEHSTVCLVDITEDINDSVEGMFEAAEARLKVGRSWLL